MLRLILNSKTKGGTVKNAADLDGATTTNNMRYRYENVKCLDCYDGDTITVLIDYGNKLTQELTVRFANINTPEVKGDEKEFGKEVRDYVKSRIEGKPIALESIKMEKFGRLLCLVYDHEGKCLNEELVEKGFAKPFMVEPA